ncbi:hypothetical protein LshimejAT787_0306580 [Lyophyllum shimeji]|uniref:Uncharacterized protein n=1 Tax=Lyophyllum shimeji TaxID=47721 RepID=A0A9P3UM54_LYOSH|nr:hypothetical protein LshimejAT787_0306580 [Lyophyllum shimeji]
MTSITGHRVAEAIHAGHLVSACHRGRSPHTDASRPTVTGRVPLVTAPSSSAFPAQIQSSSLPPPFAPAKRWI